MEVELKWKKNGRKKVFEKTKSCARFFKSFSDGILKLIRIASRSTEKVDGKVPCSQGGIPPIPPKSVMENQDELEIWTHVHVSPDLKVTTFFWRRLGGPPWEHGTLFTVFSELREAFWIRFDFCAENDSTWMTWFFLIFVSTIFFSL